MRPLNTSITNRRRTVTNRRAPDALNDKNSQLTPLHLQILQWVEGRQPGDTRPRIEAVSVFATDSAVAELVLMDMITAVAIPQTRYDRAHWEPTGLTRTGWRALLRQRRAEPRPITHSWWRLRLWG